MDLQIAKPNTICCSTGRPLEPGEPIVSALVRGDGGLKRLDWSPDGWSGAPAETIAWWRSRVPLPTATGHSLAPADVLLDAFEELQDHPGDAPLRYLLALQLIRRRIVKTVDEPPSDGADPGLLRLSCRKRNCEYLVAVVESVELADGSLAERLSALLWSGGNE